MPKFTQRALVALAIATALPAAACAATIEWRASDAGKPGKVRLRIERTAPGERNSNEHDVAVGSLPGLDLNRDGEQRFVVRREAGSLSCAGTVRSRRGTGDCRFAADPAFASTLARYGLARPSESDSFTLTMVDAQAATAQALTRFGARPSLSDFVALSVHGASPQWLQELAGAGQRGVKASDLIAYRVHGVSGPWLRGLIAADPVLADAGSGDIIAMRIHGVNPEWLRGVTAAGYGRIPASDLISMRIHGVTPEWVQGLSDAGYRNLAPDDLVAMRIHGVTPDFARAAAGMRPRPTSSELISRRIHGKR